MKLTSFPKSINIICVHSWTTQLACVILTTNHIHALDKGIRDRADEIEIKSLSPRTVFERANDILKAQGIAVEPSFLLRLLSTTSGSWRDVTRALDDFVYSKAA
jgi:DNA polymerase III gamma/tau subunit